MAGLHNRRCRFQCHPHRLGPIGRHQVVAIGASQLFCAGRAALMNRGSAEGVIANSLS